MYPQGAAPRDLTFLPPALIYEFRRLADEEEEGGIAEGESGTVMETILRVNASHPDLDLSIVLAVERGPLRKSRHAMVGERHPENLEERLGLCGETGGLCVHERHYHRYPSFGEEMFASLEGIPCPTLLL
jgi:hypothetical protein